MSFTRNNAHAYVWLIVVLNYFRSNKQILYFISAYCRANEGNSEADALETGSFTTKNTSNIQTNVYKSTKLQDHKPSDLCRALLQAGLDMGLGHRNFVWTLRCCLVPRREWQHKWKEMPPLPVTLK